MIDRQGARIIFECDSCDETFEGEERAEFTATWSEAKRDGWKTKKIGDEWVHACKNCQP